MYSLIDMTTERAQTATVLCGGCVIGDRSEVTQIAILDVENPDHPHVWANCDDDVDADRRCDKCGRTVAEANRHFMDQVAARLERKAADKSFTASQLHTTQAYGMLGESRDAYNQHGYIGPSGRWG